MHTNKEKEIVNISLQINEGASKKISKQDQRWKKRYFKTFSKQLIEEYSSLPKITLTKIYQLSNKAKKIILVISPFSYRSEKDCRGTQIVKQQTVQMK